MKDIDGTLVVILLFQRVSCPKILLKNQTLTPQHVGVGGLVAVLAGIDLGRRQYFRPDSGDAFVRFCCLPSKKEKKPCFYGISVIQSQIHH